MVTGKMLGSNTIKTNCLYTQNKPKKKQSTYPCISKFKDISYLQLSK